MHLSVACASSTYRAVPATTRLDLLLRSSLGIGQYLPVGDALGQPRSSHGPRTTLTAIRVSVNLRRVLQDFFVISSGVLDTCSGQHLLSS